MVAAATSNPIGLVVAGAAKAYGEELGKTTIEGAAKGTAQEIGDKLHVAFQNQGWNLIVERDGKRPGALPNSKSAAPAAPQATFARDGRRDSKLKDFEPPMVSTACRDGRRLADTARPCQIDLTPGSLGLIPPCWRIALKGTHAFPLFQIFSTGQSFVFLRGFHLFPRDHYSCYNPVTFLFFAVIRGQRNDLRRPSRRGSSDLTTSA